MFWIKFFFNDTATTEIYTLSLHDALPICGWRTRTRGAVPTRAGAAVRSLSRRSRVAAGRTLDPRRRAVEDRAPCTLRSEEHTSELQSRQYLVCRLLLEKKEYSYRPGRRRR